MAKKRSLVIDILGNNKIGRAVRDAMGSLRRLGGFARGIGRGIGRAFKFAAAGIAVLTAGLYASVKAAAAFNVQIARAAGMSGGIKVFRKMREEAMLLSSELGIAKDALAKGFYEAGSRGIGRDDQFGFVRQAAKLAVIDGGEVADMVIGVTNLLNAYNKSAADAKLVTNMMMASVKGGGQSFAELAENIAKASPVAASANVEINEMLGAVAQMTAKGTPANEALTAIRNAMLALNEQLGEGWGKSMSLQDALEKVAKHSNYSAIALEKIFGKRDVAKIFQMVGENAAGAAQKLDDVTKSAGTVEQQFDLIQRFRYWERLGHTLAIIATRFGIAVDEGADLNQTLDAISVKAEAIGKEFGDAMLPHIRKIREAMDDMLSGDDIRIAKGKASIEKMFDAAGSVVKPKFEAWGMAAGEAIWRGLMSGGGKAVRNASISQEQRTAGSWFRRIPSIAALSAGQAYHGGASGASGSMLEKYKAGMGAMASDIKRSYLGPGATPGNPVHVREVKPLEGVQK